MEPRIAAPHPDAASEISALALRSKAHWGYDAAFIDACREELTYSAEECASGDVFIAQAGTALAGFGMLCGGAPEGELRALFVDPPWMGRGVGTRLMTYALDLARSRGMSSVLLDADPHAMSFYLRCGARQIGEAPSGSIPGRSLPRLELQIE